MSYSSFVFENDDGVATIRLNDPERLNALHPPLGKGIIQHGG